MMPKSLLEVPWPGGSAMPNRPARPASPGRAEAGRLGSLPGLRARPSGPGRAEAGLPAAPLLASHRQAGLAGPRPGSLSAGKSPQRLNYWGGVFIPLHLPSAI